MPSAAPHSRARVVLIHSPPHGEVDFLNIGLAYLQAVLERAGVETTFFDLCFEEHHAGTDFYDEYVLELSKNIGGGVGDGVDPRLLMEVLHPEAFDRVSPVAEAILRKVETHLPRVQDAGEVFLFSINVLTEYFAAALAYRLRALGKPTAAGGPNLGFAPLRQLMLRCGAFDAVVEGDGEGVVEALVQQLADGQASLLPGVTRLRADGEPEYQPPAAPLPADALPYPSLAGMTLTYFVPILASRGCPRRCAFCSETNKARYRFRSPEDVVGEMEWAAARYANTNFHFHDDLINGSATWIDRFCELLVERRHRFTWESFCCPEKLTPARLDAMRAAGCVLLKLGVQSFSPRVLRLMRRKPDVDGIEQAIVHGSKLGISMRYDMLTCFPGETEEDHRENLARIRSIFDRTEGVHFSPNPLYLSIGSSTQAEPDRYGISLQYFDPETLPRDLRWPVAASGQFPTGFSYGISQDVVQARMRDLGDILKQEGKDYLYLGQTEVPVRRHAPGSRR